LGRYCHNGHCTTDRDVFPLDKHSSSFVWIYYGDRSVIGWTLSFRLSFAGDHDHLGATSRWIKTRVTA
jgi:hypothetical protein